MKPGMVGVPGQRLTISLADSGGSMEKKSSVSWQPPHGLRSGKSLRCDPKPWEASEETCAPPRRLLMGNLKRVAIANDRIKIMMGDMVVGAALHIPWRLVPRSCVNAPNAARRLSKRFDGLQRVPISSANEERGAAGFTFERRCEWSIPNPFH